VDARLRTLFEDISGLDMAQAEGHAAFGELGLDSLTLTQAATQIKKHFKVNLSFRQLMENYRSFDALSGFLRESLPPEAAPVAAPAAAPVTAAAMPAPVQAVAAYQPVAMPMPVYAPMQAGIGGGDPLPQLFAADGIDAPAAGPAVGRRAGRAAHDAAGHARRAGCTGCATGG
jgi:acyl carrier protein